MRFFRRQTSDSADSELLGTGTGPIRTKHMHQINLEDGCYGDGLGDPSFCQSHLADWRRSEERCDAVIAYRAQG